MKEARFFVFADGTSAGFAEDSAAASGLHHGHGGQKKSRSLFDPLVT
jgi:hypothetical protein